MHWDIDRACDWHQRRSWLCGFNYVPSTAVNTTEFWQADTFDAATIARELRLVASAGLNSCRVFIQQLVWEDDPEGFKSRFDRFLELAAGVGISVMPVLFDDCAFSKQAPYLGKQAEPQPGCMMTSWTASPGHARVVNQTQWPMLRRYVEDLTDSFGRDPRIVAWDLYNEPGNEGMGEDSLPLVEAAFGWARAVHPEQPLTIGAWYFGEEFNGFNELILAQSDIITFHQYADLPVTAEIIDRLSTYGRPILCTEWMARPLHSRIETHLPVFKQLGVGCYLWGLVNGRTQTHIPWAFLQLTTDEWFHDLFHTDGRPYRQEEIALIRKYTGVEE